jgi:hypothetical protein
VAEVKRVVRTSRIEVTDRLNELAIVEDELREAIEFGEQLAAQCTPNDPPATPGFLRWSGTVRRLRDVKAPMGWKSNDKALSVVMNPSETVAIAVQAGDEFTGTDDGINQPKTRRRIGPAAIAVIETNQRQLRLGLIFRKSPNVEQGSTCKTFFLLRRRTNNMVFAELSLPASIGPDLRVADWAERNFLEPIPLNASESSLPLPQTPTGNDGGEEITVSVKRR